MKRYIKANEIPKGCVDGEWFDIIRKQNMDVREDINECGKKYKYIGPVKSNTSVYGWRVTDGERYFAIIYTHRFGVSSVIYVFQTNKKGEYNVAKEIATYNNYVDIETCADMFFDTYVPTEEEFNYEEKELESLDDEEYVDTDKTEELD